MKEEAQERNSRLIALYPRGCLPPPGYVYWQDWADAQQLQGLEQSQCLTCQLWRFPQELTGHICTVHHTGGEDS